MNLGPDQDLEYFCNGLAEELVTGLGKVPRPACCLANLIVSCQADPKPTSGASAGSSMSMRVLEGTVRKAGDRLRITAQLVNAEDGCHLWSEGYDRFMADVFAVEDEIAHCVVDRLKITLAEFPRRPLIRQQTQNPRAYQCYLKGRFYWTRRYHGGLTTALEHFKKAIEEDAGVRAGLRWAGRRLFASWVSIRCSGRARHLLRPPRPPSVRSRSTPTCRKHIRRARFIKLANDWNCADAEREFRRALLARSESDASADLPVVAHGAPGR